jgi:hypothetical protein
MRVDRCWTSREASSDASFSQTGPGRRAPPEARSQRGEPGPSFPGPLPAPLLVVPRRPGPLALLPVRAAIPRLGGLQREARRAEAIGRMLSAHRAAAALWRVNWRDWLRPSVRSSTQMLCLNPIRSHNGSEGCRGAGSRWTRGCQPRGGCRCSSERFRCVSASVVSSLGSWPFDYRLAPFMPGL